LPSGDGHACLPFSVIQDLMKQQPDEPQLPEVKVTRI
jgi:hypothetical protein